MPWWTCFNCANIRTPHNNCNDVFVLDFAHHSLHDVPADVFQYERTLEELYLSSNRITELPRQLFYCHELKILYINDNDLSQIPPAISSLVNLKKINLARNSLTKLTDSIIACKSLTYLDLSVNNLEKLPDAIINLIGLEELYLNDTFLEFLPANFGRLTNLRILELRDNNLITLPKSMSRLNQLRRIDIGNNEFTELPDVIGHLVSLTELWCDGNRIRRINCNVANLKELIHFDGSNNLLQFLPTDIGNWQRCQELCVSTNELEELPFSIGMMKSLVALKVDENQLQELPDSICELENLEELMVSHNDLFKLPTTIGLLRRLRFLTADENLLRILPNELCSCSSLTILSVRGNKLTKIPVDIGRLTQLRVINVVNNFLSNLPVTILNLNQLSALWISDNQSQPLMPLQNEFNKESQCYYLTCFLLPQIMNTMPTSTTADSTPTNAASTPTAQDSTYDYYSPSCDESQQNAHMTALENLSLAAITARSNATNKRRICFASEPAQEITPVDQTSRLMRSPTPYPKELRMMAKFTAKNYGQHPNAHQLQLAQKFPQQRNLTNNFDEVDNFNETSNAKLLNTTNHGVVVGAELDANELKNLNNIVGQQQQQPQHSFNDFDKSNSRLYATPPLKNEIRQTNTNVDSNSSKSTNSNAVYTHQSANFNGNVTPSQQYDESSNRLPYDTDYEIDSSHQNSNYCDSSNHLPLNLLNPLTSSPNSDPLVEYESFNGKNGRKFTPNNDSSCYSSKRVSQASSSNSTSVDERTPFEPASLDINYQPQRSQHQNNNYTDKPSPKPINENHLYYQMVQQQQAQLPKIYQALPMAQNEPTHSDIYYGSVQDESEDADNDPYESSGKLNDPTVQMQQQPPPYHIAKAFTKKSKQDLLIYDIYRNNYQQHHQNQHQSSPNEQKSENNAQHLHSTSLNTTTSTSSSSYLLDKNSNTSDSNNGVDSDNNDVNASDHPSHSVIDSLLANNVKQSCTTIANNTSAANATTPWLFGVHKNPTVIQLSVPKVSSDIGFKIIKHLNQGIFISEVEKQSSAYGKLIPMDKVLDIDGVDFTKISLTDAQTVLSNSGPVINIMVSRGK